MRQHCANVTAVRDKAAARVQYMNHDGEVDPENFGSQDSICQVITEEEFEAEWYSSGEEEEEESVEDVSINMMSVKGPDDPLVVDQLTSHEYWDT